jgi:hypothetical protein
MQSVFLPWYVHAPDTPCEDELLIGVYGSDEEARAAVERLKDKPAFVDAPDGFQISRYELNQDYRTEGHIVGENRARDAPDRISTSGPKLTIARDVVEGYGPSRRRDS